jgi:HSP20 family protein
MIEQYEATGPVMSLRQMMNRLMEEAFVMPQTVQGEPPTGSLALNVFEEGENLVVEAQLPGIKPEDIEVTIERGMLTIRGEIKAEEERRDRNYLIREHRWGTFMRRLRLPETVNPDAVESQFENSVLRLVFPKSEQAKPRRINVTASGQKAMTGNGRDARNAEGDGGGRGEQSTASQSTAAGASSSASRGRDRS